MDVWQYFADREREIRELSLWIPDRMHLFGAEEGNDQRGKIYGKLLFNGYHESVFLGIHEEIIVKGSGITRPRYAYFLVIDGREIGCYERHETHDPPVHKHCSGQIEHERSPCRVMSFKDAVRDAWRYVGEFAVPSASA